MQNSFSPSLPDLLISFWLMKVSSATAVLPVWRSPMISSRWPRPIGTSASSAFRALCTLDRALAVDRVAESVDDAAEEALSDRNIDDGAGAASGRTFANIGVRT